MSMAEGFVKQELGITQSDYTRGIYSFQKIKRRNYPNVMTGFIYERENPWQTDKINPCLKTKKLKRSLLVSPSHILLRCELFSVLPISSSIHSDFDIFLSYNKKRESKETIRNLETRKQLGLMFGITELPSINPDAIDNLSGTLADSIKLKEVDSVELIHEIRGS
jgi:hypothetical protein